MKHSSLLATCHSLLTLLLTLLLPGTPALAAPPVYTIELLVFESLKPDQGEEYWPDIRVPPRPANAPTLDRLPGARLLDTRSRDLSGIEGALRRSSGYRPILYRAWRQPLAGRRQARPVWIEVNDKLMGTVRVARGRYLHLDLDLYLRTPEERIVQVTGAPGEEPMLVPRPLIVRLHQSRRMRSGELHYIDHPRFGVLALISRSPAAPPPAANAPAPSPR